LKLTINEIERFAYGVDRCEEKENRMIFHRFTKAQEDLYCTEAIQLFAKTYATAGVSLRFVTDSKWMHLNVDVKPGSSRTYFSHDVIINGVYADSLKNYDGDFLDGDYHQMVFPLGLFEKTFDLGSGEKEITVLFPALVASQLVCLELEDGASVRKIEPKGEFLFIGDSITQGYDSLLPQNRYTNRVCRAMGLVEHNLAIGGEVFRPNLAKLICDRASIERIAVSFGSNDWSLQTYEETKRKCEAFLGTLSERFGKKTIYVLSPIWRGDYRDERPFGRFERAAELIQAVCRQHENLVFLDGFDFVPHQTKLFGDGFLHPTDEGFACFAENLQRAIEITR